MRVHVHAGWLLATWWMLGHGSALAQTFVEYPAHPASYGDHLVSATWAGGPTSLTVTFDADPTILHGDGQGQSQRTARNTLQFVAPSDSTNPQDYDELQLVARYGARLPLLQQMAANGACVLSYAFSTPVATGFDLIVTDLDSADSVSVRAFGPAGEALDMRAWAVVASGDLSRFKDTGTGYSPIVAPTPATVFASDAISLVAVSNTNYNRAYTVLRAPVGTSVQRVDVRFRGTHNSASRAEAGTGSHIYVAMATTPAASGAPPQDSHGGLELSVESPARDAAFVRYTTPAAVQARLTLHDAMGRQLCGPIEASEGPGERALRLPLATRNGQRLGPGVYFLRLAAPGSGGMERAARFIVLR